MYIAFSYANESSDMYASFGFACGESTSNMPVLIGLVLFTQTVWAPVDKVQYLSTLLIILCPCLTHTYTQALQFLLNCNSRRNEFQADKFSNDLGLGQALGSGLIKISVGTY